jgi:hypothetical protein
MPIHERVKGNPFAYERVMQLKPSPAYSCTTCIFRVHVHRLLMAVNLFFKCHLLGLQARSDATSKVFPTRVPRGFISNSRGRKGGSPFFRPSLTMVFLDTNSLQVYKTKQN